MAWGTFSLTKWCWYEEVFHKPQNDLYYNCYAMCMCFFALLCFVVVVVISFSFCRSLHFHSIQTWTPHKSISVRFAGYNIRTVSLYLPLAGLYFWWIECGKDQKKCFYSFPLLKRSAQNEAEKKNRKTKKNVEKKNQHTPMSGCICYKHTDDAPYCWLSVLW